MFGLICFTPVRSWPSNAKIVGSIPSWSIFFIHLKLYIKNSNLIILKSWCTSLNNAGLLASHWHKLEDTIKL